MNGQLIHFKKNVYEETRHTVNDYADEWHSPLENERSGSDIAHCMIF